MGKVFSSREIIKMLKQDGWNLTAVEGDHHQFKHPTKPGKVYRPAPREGPLRQDPGQHLPPSRMEVRRLPMAVYVALLEHEPGRSYGVWFPDFLGCIAAGDTAEEAMRLAQSGLRFHIKGMLADGDALPPPTSVEVIAAMPESAGQIPFLVDVPTEQSKPVRLNISLDERLVKDIDSFAASRGLTRSGFLATAAREMMEAGS